MSDEGPIPNNGDGPQPNQDGIEINANSVYPRIPLPTLTEGAADTYFLSMEFWFAASGVTSDSRKYNTVLAQVPPTKLQELATIIAAAPAVNKYEYIKKALIKHFADSQTRRLQRVLSEMPLGDLRPSQLYHNMARVAGNAIGESALIDLWAARLPMISQASVVASTLPIAERLETADRVHESIALRENQVANVAPDTPTGTEMQRLIQHIDETFRRFREELPRERGNRSNTRENSRSRNRSRNRNYEHQRGNQPANNDTNGLCWYHAEFGRQAQKCREPCVWGRSTAPTTATQPTNN